jgi:hypothetical protein
VLLILCLFFIICERPIGIVPLSVGWSIVGGVVHVVGSNLSPALGVNGGEWS